MKLPKKELNCIKEFDPFQQDTEIMRASALDVAGPRNILRRYIVKIYGKN
jgi:hypothetical protein